MKSPITELKKTMSSYVTGDTTGDLVRPDNLVEIYGTGVIKALGLEKINLTIKRDEFMAIMGQSSSGESTLMNTPGCSDRPTMGYYCLDDIDTAFMNQDEPFAIRNHKIGFASQSFNLILRASALKNVELLVTYARKSEKAKGERALMLLEQVGLGARYEHWPNGLPGGQCQRVAIVRVLANEPPLILADEPTGNLGTTSSVEIVGPLSQLYKEGVTVVIVIHEENVTAFTDRIIWFQDGQMFSDVRNNHDVGRSSGAERVESYY